MDKWMEECRKRNEKEKEEREERKRVDKEWRRIEREEVQEFIKNQLRKGYIRPSKSPQTSPVFFVPKNDGK